MGAIRPARPVHLIAGLISNDTDLMRRAIRLLSEYAGAVEAVSDYWPFDTTDYYNPEMGEGLLRQFVSFGRLINPQELAAIKTLSNQIEERICLDLALPPERRRVNIDPGYVTLSKLVLATTKDYGHRIYLRDGIYAESTLHYENGRWVPWSWTYPDYAGDRYHAFFEQVRESYKNKLNARVNESMTREGVIE